MIPTRKVGSGALAGAVVAVVLWIIDAATGVEVPPEVAAALTTIVYFVTSYFVTDPTVTAPTEPEPPL